jgi:hypothetical protein
MLTMDKGSSLSSDVDKTFHTIDTKGEAHYTAVYNRNQYRDVVS